VTGPHPLSPKVVLKGPEVRLRDNDPERSIQVKPAARGLTGSQELTWDAWAARVGGCGGRDGLVAGDAEASSVLAIDLVIGRANSFMRNRSEASMPMRATSSRGVPP
jgi:hypothetical protein